MASHMQTVQIQLPDVSWYMINDGCFLCPRVSRGVGSQQMLSIWIKRPRSQLYATQSYQNALNCWIKQTSRVERMDPVSTERKLTWVCHPTQTSSEALSPSSPASPHRHPPSHFSLPPQTAACEQRNKHFRSRKKKVCELRVRAQSESLLCNFGNAVHVVSSDLLWHHTAHRQLQLQQGRS